LEQHHWWGNIRELSSVAMRYHIFGDKKDSSYAYLFDMPDTKKTPAHLVDTASFSINMKQAQHTFQQLVINDLLAQGYSKTEVAQMLHITRQTLFNRLK
jgi:propionate catabolism operon transcriptional regulator